MRTETHSGGARWASVGAHCAGAGCQRTFSSVAAFDAHRAAVDGRRVCLDPESMRSKRGDLILHLRKDRSGATIWSLPMKDPDYFEKLRAKKAEAKRLASSQ